MLIELYLVILVLAVILAFILGKAWGQFQLIKQMIDCLSPQELNTLKQLVVEERMMNAEPEHQLRQNLVNDIVATTFIDLKSESVSDTVLLYRAEDNSFVCQGDSMEDAARNFSKQYPKRIARIHSNDKVLFFINGSISSDGTTK